MENQPKLNSSKEIVAFLAKRFPQCFTIEGEAKPLKIGIFQDIFARIKDEGNISKTQLRSALRLYTSSWRYLYVIKLDAFRVDLDGNACGQLQVEHVDFAQKQLQESKARVKVKMRLRAEKLSATESKNEISVTKKTKLAKSVPPRQAGTKKDYYDKKVSQLNNSVPTKTHAETVIEQYKIVDISALKPGQQVRVKIGREAMNATVQEIVKDGIRVQLTSGMAVIVRAEHLLN